MDFKKITATEAADSIATQVVVDARRALTAGHVIRDGKTMIAEVLSDCLGGYRGPYLKACAEKANLKTVRTRVRRMTSTR